MAAAWEVFLAEFDPSDVDADRLFPDAAALEPVVRRAFAAIDPSGGVGGGVLERLPPQARAMEGSSAAGGRFPRRTGHEHRSELRSVGRRAGSGLGGALEEADAPARFGELDPPVSPETARWALGNCHLMRDRFTLADLLFFAGRWDDAFIERILDRARSAGGGL